MWSLTRGESEETRVSSNILGEVGIEGGIEGEEVGGELLTQLVCPLDKAQNLRIWRVRGDDQGERTVRTRGTVRT